MKKNTRIIVSALAILLIVFLISSDITGMGIFDTIRAWRTKEKTPIEPATEKAADTTTAKYADTNGYTDMNGYAKEGYVDPQVCIRNCKNGVNAGSCKEAAVCKGRADENRKEGHSVEPGFTDCCVTCCYGGKVSTCIEDEQLLDCIPREKAKEICTITQKSCHQYCEAAYSDCTLYIDERERCPGTYGIFCGADCSGCSMSDLHGLLDCLYKGIPCNQ